MKDKQRIGLYGIFAVGESFLAQGLGSKLWDHDKITPNNLLAIARRFDSKNYSRRFTLINKQNSIENGLKICYSNKL